MSFTELSEQEIIRRNSLNELAKMGIEAYPAPEFKVDAHAADIKERFDDNAEPRQVVIAGRMMSRRIMGKASFLSCRMQRDAFRCMSAGMIFPEMRRLRNTIRYLKS